MQKLSYYKINCYGMYIEDVLHLESYPDIGAGRGKLMPSEIKEIIREASLNNVTIIPFFQLIGHYENILAMDNYKHLGKPVFQSMSSLDPKNPEVRVFLADCIEEVCQLFPGKYFGMGFDETQGVDMESYIGHANWCAQEITKYGKIPVLWVDMLYNHWGVDAIKQLDPSLVPANWNYDTTSLPIPHQLELEAQGRPVWGFAGYNNWARFMPDFEKSKTHISTWTSYLGTKPDSALLCTQWGDNGYENSRDLCWNLFAYMGECCWSGPDSDRNSFEDRFQRSFYDAILPGVKDVVFNMSKNLSFDQVWYWEMHRKNAWSLFRHAATNPEWKQLLEKDAEVLEQAMIKVEKDYAQANSENQHIDHFVLSLRLILLVAKRLLFAYKHLDSMDSPDCREVAEKLVYEIFDARDFYASVWLRQNKYENMEVSLSVFNEVAASYEMLVSKGTPHPRPGFQALGLSPYHNTCHLDIGGIPIGSQILH